MKISSFNNTKIKILIHVVVWLFFFIMPWLIFNVKWNDNNVQLHRYYYRIIINGIFFYVLYLWLVPTYFFSQRKIVFFIVTTILISAFYLFFEYTNDSLFPESQKDEAFRQEVSILAKKANMQSPPFKKMHLYDFVLSLLLISGASVGIRVMEKLSENEKIRRELESEKLQSELVFLKYQVSPHFFFNTLNNIYSLIEVDSKDAQTAVLKLSKMMRYLLYETEPKKALISTEITFMSNYIDLMRLRLTEKVDLKVSFPEIATDFLIPPLLFIPFIENAFKHGISNREPSFIKIDMQIDNQNIIFNVRNSIFDLTFNEKDSKTGIGLENVKKRLKLLFNDKYKLTISNENNIHDVMLQINNS